MSPIPTTAYPICFAIPIAPLYARYCKQLECKAEAMEMDFIHPAFAGGGDTVIAMKPLP
jgi:hypothetical protein